MRQKTIEEKEWQVSRPKEAHFKIQDDTRPYFIEYPEGWQNHEHQNFWKLSDSVSKMWWKHSCLRELKFEKPVKEKVQFTI